MEIRINEDNPELYCTYCKNKIYTGQKFVIITENLFGGQTIKKEYHINDICTPTNEDLDDNIWISSEQ